MDTPVSLPAHAVHPVIAYLRDHRWARRAISLVSVGLLAVAVGMIGYPVYTNFVFDRQQSRLTREFASPEIQQAYRERRLQVGDSLTRIRIPKLDVDAIVVEGTSASALRAGAGHYPQTPLPCEDGNVAIAGHRTTYGKPFANVDRLQKGDEIVLETPIGSCTYEVLEAPRIVAPTDLSVIAPSPGNKMLTLTSCHPKGSAAKRIIVQATLVKDVPIQS